MASTERKEVVSPVSPAEALLLSVPQMLWSAGSALVPHSDPACAPNNWDSDRSPEPVWDGMQGGTHHPELGHMPASEHTVTPSGTIWIEHGKGVVS